MAIQRKPVPSGEDTTLPYPLTPQSPQLGPFHEELPPSLSTGVLSQSSPHHTPSASNVSDISDGWVDGGLGAQEQTRREPTPAAGHGLFGQHLDAVPSALMIGQHSNHSQGSSLSSVPYDNGFEQVERPRTNQSNTSNNPFHRARNSEGQNAPFVPQTVDASEMWTEITEPQQSTLGNNGHDLLVPEVSNMSISDPPKQNYEPFRPSSAAQSQPHLANPGQDLVPKQSFELPASPVVLRTASQNGGGNGQDIWANLDSAFGATSAAKAEHSEQVWANAPIPVTPSRAPTLPPVTSLQQQPSPMLPPATQRSNAEHVDHNPFRSSTDVARPAHPFSHAVATEQTELPAGSPTDTTEQTSTPSAQYSGAQSAVAAAKQAPFRAQPITDEQKGETYPIKQIRWLDDNSGEIRMTPIMIQNANGPCPLLALVNALTLSTPAGLNTALLETLRTREQVSLGLLLDAVFDELMSGRRGSAALELPDVSELYSFLCSLHTGMNVNPRFVPRNQNATLIDDLEPSNMEEPGFRHAGGFEDTREMMLYGTFAVQLVHGWLPPKRHPAFMALARSASTYEDAQNLMFREEELEDKLQSHGLTSDEQQLLQDIASIKAFLQSSATQLTGYGLDVVADNLAPGSVAILFRNDHFSTLYKQPRSGQLLSLVTDFGYASHAEIVWESLVDVSGEACEFYSGDFRPVGNSTAQQQAQETGWIDEHEHAVAAGGQDASAHNAQTAHHNTEQEDADFALAMQLQEEEDDRQRRAAQARRAEEQASQAYISNAQDSRDSRVQAPRNRTNPGRPSPSPALAPGSSAAGRRQSSGTTAATGSANPPLPVRREPGPQAAAAPVRLNPNDREGGEDAPPPTYEQAAKVAPYTGPVPSPNAGVGSSGSRETYAQMRASNGAQRDYYTRPRGQSAYGQNARGNFPTIASGSGQVPSPDAARRRASGAAMTSYEHAMGNLSRRSTGERERERDKDCVVM